MSYHIAQRDDPADRNRVVFVPLEAEPDEYEWRTTVAERLNWLVAGWVRHGLSPAEAEIEVARNEGGYQAQLRALPPEAVLYGQCGHSPMYRDAKTAEAHFWHLA